MDQISEVRQLLAAGRKREAQKLAERLRESGGGPVATAVLARVSLQCGELRHAAALARDVLRSHYADWESRGEARYVLAAAAVHIGDLAEAEGAARAFLTDLHRYRSLADLRGVVHYNLALAYRHQQRLDAALVQYESAIEHAGDDAEVVDRSRVNRAWILVMQRRVELAEDELVQVANSTRPETAVFVLCTRAFAQIQTGDMETALATLQAVLSGGHELSDYHLAEAGWLMGLAVRQTNMAAARWWVDGGLAHAQRTLYSDVINRLQQLRDSLADGAAD